MSGIIIIIIIPHIYVWSLVRKDPPMLNAQTDDIPS